MSPQIRQRTIKIILIMTTIYQAPYDDNLFSFRNCDPTVIRMQIRIATVSQSQWCVLVFVTSATTATTTAMEVTTQVSSETSTGGVFCTAVKMGNASLSSAFSALLILIWVDIRASARENAIEHFFRYLYLSVCPVVFIRNKIGPSAPKPQPKWHQLNRIEGKIKTPIKQARW